MDFNDNQKRVIEFGEGTLLVEAGPGSGKTTVIVARIEELIKRGVDPETFLVITFTTKAADNLKNKLRQRLSESIVSKMQISTIHSFCLEYLKGKNLSLSLLDGDTSERKTLFVEKFKKELGFVNEATVFDYHIPDILKKFSLMQSLILRAMKFFFDVIEFLDGFKNYIIKVIVYVFSAKY